MRMINKALTDKINIGQNKSSYKQMDTRRSDEEEDR